MRITEEQQKVLDSLRCERLSSNDVNQEAGTLETRRIEFFDNFNSQE